MLSRTLRVVRLPSASLGVRGFGNEAAVPKAKLPDLPYDFDALKPVISGQIMELHYKKHHQGYVDNFNKSAEQLHEAEKKNDIAEIINLQASLRFNGGGHLNHSIFWTNLIPQSKFVEPSGELLNAINRQWGSLKQFQSTMSTTTVGILGSGWGWLVWSKATCSLQIVTQPNQDPIVGSLVPLLGVDVWEHAYYLDYKNVRADYVKNIWSIVNWKNVEERFATATKKQ